MSTLTRMWARVVAIVTGLVVALVVPAVAWAHSNPQVLAATEEVARRRPRIGGFGLLGGLCCLVVVLLIVGLVLLIARRRGSR